MHKNPKYTTLKFGGFKMKQIASHTSLADRRRTGDRGKGDFGLLDWSQITGLCSPNLKPQCISPDLGWQRE